MLLSFFAFANWLWLVPALPAQALPERVKVRLFSTQKQIERIVVYGPAEILQPARQSLGPGLFVIDTGGGGIALSRIGRGNKSLLRRLPFIVLTGSVRAKDGLLKIGLSTSAVPRFYRGTVEVRPAGGTALSAVNDVPVHSYIAGCVGSESPPAFGPEALKAQAVLSTTLLEKNYRGRPIDDSTEEQSYLGASGERPPVKAAVESVFGEELYYKGEPAEVFFCSTCGGTTSTPSVFGGKVAEDRYPYLKEVTCRFCSASPFYQEHRESISSAHFAQATGMQSPQVVSEHIGRPVEISFLKKGHRSTLSGYRFWLAVGQSLGWGLIPSTFYRIENVGGGGPKTLAFVSRGCGHGVGLCQWGAAGQSREGRGYKEILLFYFPGTSLKNRACRAVEPPLQK